MRSNYQVSPQSQFRTKASTVLIFPNFSFSDTFKELTEDFAIDKATVGSSQDVRAKKAMKFEASASSSKTHYLTSQPHLLLQLNRWKLSHEFQGGYAVAWNGFYRISASISVRMKFYTKRCRGERS